MYPAGRGHPVGWSRGVRGRDGITSVIPSPGGLAEAGVQCSETSARVEVGGCGSCLGEREKRHKLTTVPAIFMHLFISNDVGTGYERTHPVSPWARLHASSRNMTPSQSDTALTLVVAQPHGRGHGTQWALGSVGRANGFDGNLQGLWGLVPGHWAEIGLQGGPRAEGD